MEKLEPMDILRVPNKDETIVASFRKWIASYQTNDNVTIFTFKKETPKKILKSFQKHFKLFPKILGFEVSPNYEIEK